jgi:TatD DNase family protein
VKLTDTHCHLNFHNFRDDLDQVLERARKAGVERVLVPAIDLATSREISILIEKDQMLYGAVGVHPNSGNSWRNDTPASLRELTSHTRIAAIGEIGLDYYRDRTPHEIQQRILKEQLSLAVEVDLPVVIHVRNRSEEDRQCMNDLLEILKDWTRTRQSQSTRPPGVIHSFSGNTAESGRAQDLGFYIGITGPVTYKNAEEMREVVRHLDLSRLLIETDGPFLSPQQKRGKRNEPAHVFYIIDKISELRQIEPVVIAEQTAKNAACLFQWE